MSEQNSTSRILALHTFRAGQSNYNYLLYQPQTKIALAIDPFDAPSMLMQSQKLGLRIRAVINTHGHWDHVAGNAGVIAATQARLFAGEHEDIPDVNVLLKDGQTLAIEGFSLRVLFTPGHTPGHISFIADEQYLFVGDTLFFGGCGNCVNGGNPSALFKSLEMLSTLPGHLKICCGHEYALKNLNFCKVYEPQNHAIDLAHAKVERLLAEGQVVFSTLAEEKTYNVFLRTHETTLQASMREKFPNLSSEPEAIFKKLRELRNNY